jgi:hypothetical protein
MAAAKVAQFPTIKSIKTYLTSGVSAGTIVPLERTDRLPRLAPAATTTM